MQTLRVNLLPPEILEKRRWERYYPYVFLGFVIVLAVLLVVAAVLFFAATQKASELQQLEDQVQKVRTQANAYAIFETDEKNLLARETVAQKTLDGRINMGKIAEEVSLILPEEIWLDVMSGSEKDGLILTGYSPVKDKHTIDMGYGSIAKLLVRLNSLKNLRESWFSAGTKAEFKDQQSTIEGAVNTVVFTVKATITTQTVAPIAAPAGIPPAPPAGGTTGAN